MADEQNPRHIQLHFSGPAAKGHTVPALELVRSLKSIQRAIFLVAKMENGQELGMRARVSLEEERLFGLVCKVPEHGGYTIPTEIGNPTERLFDPTIVNTVAKKFTEVARIAGSGDEESFKRLVPDRGYRAGILKSFKDSQPPTRSGLNLSLEHSDGSVFLNGNSARTALESLDKAPEQEPGYIPGFVTGTLVEMKFEDRQFAMKLHSGRQISASYAEHYETILTEHPRSLIQAFGNVTYDENGLVKAITEVRDIVEVDTSDLLISEINLDGKNYKILPPIEFEIKFHEEESLFELSGSLDIHVAAESRRDLEDSVEAELRMLWEEFACVDDRELSPSAQKLAQQLRELFKEDVDA